MDLKTDWILTPYRALVHRPTATAIIADLHLGYAAARRHSGEVVPEIGEDVLLQRVSRLVEAYHLERLVIAGDMVEQGYSGSLAAARFVISVRKFGASVILVPGNHDLDLGSVPGLEKVESALFIGDWRVVHQAEPTDKRPCIMGHWHPVVRSTYFQGQVPCYLSTPARFLLPAQSEDAAGDNILNWRDCLAAECHVIVKDQVLAMGTLANLQRRFQKKTRA